MYRHNRVAVEAPAKINLHLDITGVREDGYHLLDTVMQAVDLRDLVIIGRTSSPGIRVTCTRPGIPEDERNLAYKAAELFVLAVGLRITGGLHIHVDKAIPHEAGLGGGSADAAAALAGMNALFERPLSPDRLCELGLALGADVPFALRGGCALCRGIGERMTALEPGLPPCWIVLAKPAGGMSTAEAYGRYDGQGGLRHRSSQGMRRAVASGELSACAREMFNVFEQVEGVGDTAALGAAMIARGALGCALSGSGSAVAGLFAVRRAAESSVNALGGSAREAFLCTPVPYGAKVIHIS